MKLFDDHGSMQVNDVLKRQDNLYYVYATDYRVSNLSGIRIFSIRIDKGKIHFNSLLSREKLSNQFEYDDNTEVLYVHDGHVYFEEIKNNGAEVLIKAGESSVMLKLVNEEQYIIQ